MGSLLGIRRRLGARDVGSSGAPSSRTRNTSKVLDFVVALDHYRRGEFEDALAEAKRANLPNYMGTPILIAAAAGRLQRVTEAKAAFDGLRRNRPEYLDPEKTRSFLRRGFGRATSSTHDGWIRESQGARYRPWRRRVIGLAEPQSAIPARRCSDSQRLDRRASLYRHERREGSGLVLRWRGRRDSQCAVAGERSPCRRPRIGVLVPRQSRRPEGDRREAAGRHGARRQRAPFGRSVAHHGASFRRDERVSVVVGAIRCESQRNFRRPGGDRESRCRASRNGSDSAAQPHVVRHTENQEAYHLYLRGRHLWYSRSKGSLQRARELFEEARARIRTTCCRG